MTISLRGFTKRIIVEKWHLNVSVQFEPSNESLQIPVDGRVNVVTTAVMLTG